MGGVGRGGGPGKVIFYKTRPDRTSPRPRVQSSVSHEHLCGDTQERPRRGGQSLQRASRSSLTFRSQQVSLPTELGKHFRFPELVDFKIIEKGRSRICLFACFCACLLNQQLELQGSEDFVPRSIRAPGAVPGTHRCSVDEAARCCVRRGDSVLSDKRNSNH